MWLFEACGWQSVFQVWIRIWYSVQFSVMQSVVRVQVRVCDCFGGVSITFVYESEAAWLAKQCVGVGDDKISVELWWTSYLFIQVVLRWSARHCRTTGVNCGHIGQVRHAVIRLSREPALW